MANFGETAVLWKPMSQAVLDIRNIFCVGRNYRDHAIELGNAVPEKPLVFGKSTHALTPAESIVHLPHNRSNIHHEIEIVLYIGKAYSSGMSVDELVEAVGLGLDLTDRDAQSELKKAGQPWELAKGFPGSAVVGNFYMIDKIARLTQSTFALELNGEIVQSGSPAQMIFDFQTLIDYVGSNFGLNEHDILYTGTPKGVGPLADGQKAKLMMDGREWGNFEISYA